MSTRIEAWVRECADLVRPDRVVWCDGSDAEYRRLIEQMVADGTLLELDQAALPGCFLHRSHPTDVARTEQLTFSVTARREDVGPTNNWMSREDADARVKPLFAGAMRGRTMYVVPYLMGPPGSPFARVGVEITDSPYVVANMRIMTTMGRRAMEQPGADETFVPGLHSLGDLRPDRRFILHFLEEPAVWSVGSGYGGNALLGKKCFALRIAGALARKEGWLAEHMLILGLDDPEGRTTYIAAAFPSACGKTNLAMMISPLEAQGWRVRTVGDDIAWMRPGPDGRLWAVNPEAGFFGVAPGTSDRTNPAAMATIGRNTIYTNVGLTPDRRVWWEGLSAEPPPGTLDWQGRPWNHDLHTPVAHPNSRFTAPASQCPTISPEWRNPQGVPIDAVLFGGRRARLAPLVFQARNWQHGVFLGATMASETTAAATGELGKVRRDPMAMLPFCAYNMGDYFGHWLSMERRLARPPAVFHVNWFRKSVDGEYLWPGFGQNIRVLLWVLGRIRGTAAATETPIGLVPTPESLPLEGLPLGKGALRELLAVDTHDWSEAIPPMREFFAQFGDRLPPGMTEELDGLERRLHAAG